MKLTPIESFSDGTFAKREDLFEIFGCNGAKARAAYQIITDAAKQGYTHFITAGPVASPQCEIVATICHNLGYEATFVMPDKSNRTELTSVENHILEYGYEIHRGFHLSYRTVLNGKMNQWIERQENHNEWYKIPFGMECPEDIYANIDQVLSIKDLVSSGSIKRIVIPCGSGMNVASVALGLLKHHIHVPILAVRTGPNSKSFAGAKFLSDISLSNITLVPATHEYSESLDIVWNDIRLDPTYEAKCVEFLQPGDLFWIIGHRRFD